MFPQIKCRAKHLTAGAKGTQNPFSFELIDQPQSSFLCSWTFSGLLQETFLPCYSGEVLNFGA